MRLVSPLLKHVVYPGLSRSGYLRRRASPAPSVVTYHGVLPRGYQVRDVALDGHLVTAEAFTEQILLLKKNYDIISPEEFLQWCEGQLELPGRSVLLTCDDGLLNTVTDMLPIVRTQGIPFLFFVTGASANKVRSMLWYEQLFLWLQLAKNGALLDLRGNANGRRVQISVLRNQLVKQFSALDWCRRAQALQDLRTRIGISIDWESEYSEDEALRRRFFMLNVTELRQLQKDGITIGAHTVSHPMLAQMSEERAFEEMVQSRMRLQDVLDMPIWAMAFPFGNPDAVSVREPELARRAGFKCAFMNVEDVSAASRFALPRVHVSLHMSLAEFDAHVSGFHHSIRSKFASTAMPA
jgi:peptidoglycan/xylan/chitin deacetylase (PgdA/CDA1 family)